MVYIEEKLFFLLMFFGECFIKFYRNLKMFIKKIIFILYKFLNIYYKYIEFICILMVFWLVENCICDNYVCYLVLYIILFDILINNI